MGGIGVDVLDGQRCRGKPGMGVPLDLVEPDMESTRMRGCLNVMTMTNC